MLGYGSVDHQSTMEFPGRINFDSPEHTSPFILPVLLLWFDVAFGSHETSAETMEVGGLERVLGHVVHAFGCVRHYMATKASQQEEKQTESERSSKKYIKKKIYI